MPNWCRNSLLVEGSPEDLLKFKNAVYSEEFEGPLDFDRILPMPVELKVNEDSTDKRKENVEKYGYEDWYYWRIANWGTKWNLNDGTKVSEERDSLSYTFGTAWSPPLGIFKAMTEMFPSLTFSGKFIEHAMGICGTFTGENGVFDLRPLDYETAAVICEGPEEFLMLVRLYDHG